MKVLRHEFDLLMEEPAQWAPHSLGGLPGVVIFIGQVFLASYPILPLLEGNIQAMI